MSEIAMTHSATMTIDQRYKFSAFAWLMAAIWALALALAASAVVGGQSHTQLPHDSTSPPYGYVTQGNNV